MALRVSLRVRLEQQCQQYRPISKALSLYGAPVGCAGPAGGTAVKRLLSQPSIAQKNYLAPIRVLKA